MAYAAVLEALEIADKKINTLRVAIKRIREQDAKAQAEAAKNTGAQPGVKR